MEAGLLWDPKAASTRPEVTGARENLHVRLWACVGSALTPSPLPEAHPRSGRARGAEPGHEVSLEGGSLFRPPQGPSCRSISTSGQLPDLGPGTLTLTPGDTSSPSLPEFGKGLLAYGTLDPGVQEWW